MMQRLIILITAILFASSTWATATGFEWTDTGKAAYACAEVYAYTIAITEEVEQIEDIKEKLNFWKNNIDGYAPYMSADALIGRSSFRKSLDAKLISEDEVVKIIANCKMIRKEIEALAMKSDKCCMTITK